MLDYVLLTSPLPSNGPVLQFIIDLLKDLKIQLADFQTPKFYSSLLQVFFVYRLFNNRFVFNYSVSLKGNQAWLCYVLLCVKPGKELPLPRKHKVKFINN